MAEETKATGSEKESPPAAVNEKGKQPEATAPPAPEDKTQPGKTDPGKTAPAVKSEEKDAVAPEKDKPAHEGTLIDLSEIFKDKAVDDRLRVNVRLFTVPFWGLLFYRKTGCSSISLLKMCFSVRSGM